MPNSHWETIQRSSNISTCKSFQYPDIWEDIEAVELFSSHNLYLVSCSERWHPMRFLTGIILSAIVPHNSWINIFSIVLMLQHFVTRLFVFFLLSSQAMWHVTVSSHVTSRYYGQTAAASFFRQRSKIRNLNLDFILGLKNKVSNLYIFVNLLWL